ncbi:MAG TPA: CRTAC1 family protein, partial [Methylomirabilota bacterium]|nr:CRTAC1 family protein [Methylomirabilota bacterium]
PNFLYRNDGGRFTEVGTISGAAYAEDGRSQAGMGVDAGDYDNDGRMDLFVTNFSHDYSTLRHNEGGLFFLDVSVEAGIGAATMTTLGWGTGFLDYDNDGFKDLFLANGHVFPSIDAFNIGTTWKQKNQLFRNVDGTRFRDVSADAGPPFRELHSARGCAFGDLDDDGDLDIVVNNIDEIPTLLRNDGGSRARWIGFRLAGRGGNRHAVGARVTVVAGGRRQTGEVHAGSSHNSSHDPRLHFGLGGAAAVDRVEIRWPSGRTQTVTGLTAGRYHVITEPGGAAP